METVDYGDTSEEDTTDQPTIKTESTSLPNNPTSQSSNSNSKSMSQSDIINHNLDNLASLIPILQSHQQLIEAESNSILQNQTKKAHKHTNKKSSKKHQINTNNNNQNPLLPTPMTTSLDNPESIAYFILRSNNEENVRTSMEKGVWATQPQNEPILNEAFEKFEKVFLFFSVCRSMHFQGLAQMTSRIGHHKSRSLWEADPHTRNRGKSKWGGTFTIRWFRIFDLAFDQTNNICNPWNGNRPVKFSRDGQAVPFHVGQQLTHLFDIGVMEFGQGSAILRKPIMIGDPSHNDIAVQKVFVNGRFMPATDIQTAQNMIALEQQQQQTIKNSHSHTPVNNNNNNNNNNEAANALNRLVNSLQKQTDTNVIGNININNANNLLNIASLLSNDLNTNKKSKHSKHRDKNSKQRDRKRDRSRERHRHKRESEYESYSSDMSENRRNKYKNRHRDRRHRNRRERHMEHRERERDRNRNRNRNRNRDRDSNRKDKKNNKRDGGNDKRKEQEVINSLWTQINLQQALLAQSGLYNALNVNGEVNGNNITTTAPPPKYPSNRGGVY